MTSNNSVWIAMVVVTIIAVGGYFTPQTEPVVNNDLGAGTRFPNGISANTNAPATTGQVRGTTLLLDTTNTATSTATVGCIQTYATSTASPVRVVLSSVASTSLTFGAGTATGGVFWQFGTCPV